MSDPSRRRVLKVGAALTSIGAVGTLPGCSGLLGGGDDVTYDWLYEPGAVRDRDHYSFRYMEPETVAEHEGQFRSETYDRLEAVESTFEFLDVQFREVSALLEFGPVTVLSAQFDPGRVETTLEQRDFDVEDSRNGYTVYESNFDDWVVAFQGELMVLAEETDGADALDVLDATMAAASGDGRYADSSEAFDSLVGTLGTGTVATGGTHEPGGSRPGEGTAIEYGETVEGELTDEDPREADLRGFHDRYTFTASEGDRVTVSMQSDPGDTYLILLGPGGQRVAEDDDGGQDLNSRLTTRLPETGRYTVVATSFDDRETFPYELSLDASESSSDATLRTVAGAVATGWTLSVEGERSERTWAVVFESADAADTDAVRSVVRADGDTQFAAYEDLTVEAAGDRVVTVTGTIDTADVRF